VYAETGADVTTVLVGGRVVLDHGRVLTVDEGKLQTKPRKRRIGCVRKHAAWALAPTIAPYVTAACRAAWPSLTLNPLRCTHHVRS